MISINDLYIAVNNDLARKDHAGYTSTDEFNRINNLIQGLLMDYYLEKNDARAKEALRPFVEEVKIQSTTEYYDLPEDYRQRLDVGFETATNSTTGGEPTFTITSASHLDYDEELQTAESAILRDSQAFSLIGSQIKVRPSTFIGRVYLKYYRNPADASRAFTLNVTTKEEEYDSVNTVDLEWNQSEWNNFVTLHLFFKGLSTRNTDLVQWVMAKQNVELLTAQDND
jgi:hypothetical protein